jgi:hypothetical protein
MIFDAFDRTANFVTELQDADRLVGKKAAIGLYPVASCFSRPSSPCFPSAAVPAVDRQPKAPAIAAAEPEFPTL